MAKTRMSVNSERTRKVPAYKQWETTGRLAFSLQYNTFNDLQSRRKDRRIHKVKSQDPMNVDTVIHLPHIFPRDDEPDTN